MGNGVKRLKVQMGNREDVAARPELEFSGSANMVIISEHTGHEKAYLYSLILRHMDVVGSLVLWNQG